MSIKVSVKIVASFSSFSSVNKPLRQKFFIFYRQQTSRRIESVLIPNITIDHTLSLPSVLETKLINVLSAYIINNYDTIINLNVYFLILFAKIIYKFMDRKFIIGICCLRINQENTVN